MTQTKPIIAVIEAWGNATSALRMAGATVIEVDNKDELSLALGAVDAIVLTGGGDVNPGRYGEDRHRQSQVTDMVRDKMEFRAVIEARRRRIPLLGICRGHQLLNVAYGGTLHQHIPDLGVHLKEHAYGEHLVKLDTGSRIGQTLDSDRLMGVSLHHQAIGRIGDGLIPIGWSRDGLIEMIESVPGTRPYVLGVQFHPEMEFRTYEKAAAIFEHFTRIASQRAANRGHYDERLASVESLIPGKAYNYGSKYGHYYSIKETSEHNVDDERSKVDHPEPDKWCKFPPCRSPESCLLYEDCAAEVVAAQKAQKALPAKVVNLSKNKNKRGNRRNHSKSYLNRRERH